MQWWVIIVGYLIGNFSASFLVAKITANIDIREHGSGNAGSTNVLRTLGLRAGAIAFVGDSLKGVAAVLLATYVGGIELILLTGLAVTIGHNWPVLLKFKGGKGIATTIGVVLVIHPPTAIICILFGVIILYRYRYVSLASVSAMILLPIVAYFLLGPSYLLFTIFLSVMAVYRHRSNIIRLKNGTENKIGSKSKK